MQHAQVFKSTKEASCGSELQLIDPSGICKYGTVIVDELYHHTAIKESQSLT